MITDNITTFKLIIISFIRTISQGTDILGNKTNLKNIQLTTLYLLLFIRDGIKPTQICYRSIQSNNKMAKEFSPPPPQNILATMSNCVCVSVCMYNMFSLCVWECVSCRIADLKRVNKFRCDCFYRKIDFIALVSNYVWLISIQQFNVYLLKCRGGFITVIKFSYQK